MYKNVQVQSKSKSGFGFAHHWLKSKASAWYLLNFIAPLQQKYAKTQFSLIQILSCNEVDPLFKPRIDGVVLEKSAGEYLHNLDFPALPYMTGTVRSEFGGFHLTIIWVYFRLCVCLFGIYSLNFQRIWTKSHMNIIKGDTANVVKPSFTQHLVGYLSYYNTFWWVRVRGEPHGLKAMHTRPPTKMHSSRRHKINMIRGNFIIRQLHGRKCDCGCAMLLIFYPRPSYCTMHITHILSTI